MSEPMHLKLKERLATACETLKVPFSVFARLTDLNQFLLDVADIQSPRTLAAKALANLNSDATGMARYVACVAIVELLDREFGVPVQDPEPRAPP